MGGFEVGFGVFESLCFTRGFLRILLKGKVLFIFLFSCFRLDSNHSVFTVHIILIKLLFGFHFISIPLLDNVPLLIINYLTPTNLLLLFHPKPHNLNNFLHRLLLHRLILLQITRVVLGITSQDVHYIPAFIRDVQRCDDNGDQMVDHGLLELVTGFAVLVFFALV